MPPLCMRPGRFSVCAPVSARARLSNRPLLFSTGCPALFNTQVRLDPRGCAQLSEFLRMFTAGEAHADPAIPPDSGTTARRTTLWVPNPQRGDPSWLFRSKNCNPSPASWPPATCDTAAESGAKNDLTTRPLQAFMDTVNSPEKGEGLGDYDPERD